MPHSIYRHIDPRDGATRYVGRSIDPYQRFLQHLYAPGNDEMQAWHDELAELGLKPLLDIIETDIEEESKAKEREWYWIGYYLNLGEDLTNYVLLTHMRRRLAKRLAPYVWEHLPIVSPENKEALDKRRSRLELQCAHILPTFGYKFAFCRRKHEESFYAYDLFILHRPGCGHRHQVMQLEEFDTINSVQFYELFPQRMKEAFSQCNCSSDAH